MREQPWRPNNDPIMVKRLPSCAKPGCTREATRQNGVTWKTYCSRHWDDRGLFWWERFPLIVVSSPQTADEAEETTDERTM